MDRAPRGIASDSHRDRPARAVPEDAGAAPGGGQPVGWADEGGPTIRTGPRIDLAHLPAGAEHFQGRGPELAALEAAWAPGSGIAAVALIAPGGTGKTALVKRWLGRVRAAGWGGAAQVYGWTFYSQGTADDRQASEDHFLARAIDWLGIAIDPAAHPADKGRAIARAVAARRTLLVLDGVEPLQYPPGPMAGELRAPGLKALLGHLAAAGQPGLCVLTSRARLADLAEWERGQHRPEGAVQSLDLGNLDDTDGARLLHILGARRAGAAPIPDDDPELKTASREVRGHALALSLLGRYLRLAQGGDIRARDRIDPRAADDETHKGHAFRVMAAYERWFAGAGESGARQLAALRLLGFFDRPASAADLAALRAAPPIRGLTEPLFARPRGSGKGQRRPSEPIGEEPWRIALKRLEDAGLIEPPADDGMIDAHPLVREYLAASLAERLPKAWREGHRRLYARLKDSVPYRPEGLDGLQPLYRAVAHGCPGGAVGGGLRRGLYRPHPARGGERWLLQHEQARRLRCQPGGGRLPLRRALAPTGPDPGPRRGRPSLAAQRDRQPTALLGPSGGSTGAHAGRSGDDSEAGGLEERGPRLRQPERAATEPGPGLRCGGGRQAIGGVCRPQRRCRQTHGNAQRPGGRPAPAGRDR